MYLIGKDNSLQIQKQTTLGHQCLPYPTYEFLIAPRKGIYQWRRRRQIAPHKKTQNSHINTIPKASLFGIVQELLSSSPKEKKQKSSICIDPDSSQVQQIKQTKEKKVEKLKWSKRNEKLFKKLVLKFGTDFSLIAEYFKQYTSHHFTKNQLKNKYNRDFQKSSKFDQQSLPTMRKVSQDSIDQEICLNINNQLKPDEQFP